MSDRHDHTLALYPVIMCGGAGTRLWPASRPSRPKQFMPLAGNRSLFQETAVRVAPLCENGGLIVVAGLAHRQAVIEQLDALGLEAQIILEPQARDSAPAMAAAADWTAARSTDAINVFVASDHYIPDHDAFRSAVRRAAVAAAKGNIVTLGVRPRAPSSAYGYIRPAGQDLARVAAFVEKPDRETAQRYIDEGYLWNSGNFVASARTLLDELSHHAPAVVEAASRSLPPPASDHTVVILGDDFLQAPRISIDYAVMEKTERACVLPVDFDWSDLGAWDAVAETGEGNVGAHLFEDVENTLVRACDGVLVAAIGVRNLAIIVERDAVLVTDLARSQEVKAIVERLRQASPAHLDFATEPQEDLVAGAVRLSDWMRTRVLPLWSTIGHSVSGAFAELMGQDGRAVEAARRARVQARQLHVLAEAGRHGWAGDVEHGLAQGWAWLDQRYVGPGGRMRTLVSAAGDVLDETAMLYDQAFLLLALASTFRLSANPNDRDRAERVRDDLLSTAPATGGLVENGDHPYQSNAHMHLLEACLAWEEAGGDADWGRLADRIVDLALTRFIDGDRGCLREFFKHDWAPAEGDDGRRIEPGHQFEWAWLLVRYGRARVQDAPLSAARRLYAFGLRGIDPVRGVSVDALDIEGTITQSRARLWPQTEWLKAALILSECAQDADRDQWLADAAQAQRAVWRYLSADGLWHDTMLQDASFLDQPAPASTLYHLMGAWTQLASTLGTTGSSEADLIRLD